MGEAIPEPALLVFGDLFLGFGLPFWASGALLTILLAQVVLVLFTRRRMTLAWAGATLVLILLALVVPGTYTAWDVRASMQHAVDKGYNLSLVHSPHFDAPPHHRLVPTVSSFKRMDGSSAKYLLFFDERTGQAVINEMEDHGLDALRKR